MNLWEGGSERRNGKEMQTNNMPFIQPQTFPKLNAYTMD